jgi:DNA-binding response OmpR family regulator
MRLLLVEADETARVDLSQILRGEGYAADVASDGDEAVRLAERVSYAALLLAVRLPRREGLGVLGRLRLGDAAIPVVLLAERMPTAASRGWMPAPMTSC